MTPLPNTNHSQAAAAMVNTALRGVESLSMEATRNARAELDGMATMLSRLELTNRATVQGVHDAVWTARPSGPIPPYGQPGRSEYRTEWTRRLVVALGWSE